jgi:hypothetical protein
LLKTGSSLTGSVREHDAQGAVYNGKAMIDGRAGDLGLFGGLESHIVQQGCICARAGNNRIGLMDTFPPAEKVQKLICITGQSDIRHASKELAIQVAIDPVDFPACGLLNDTERTACVAGRRLVVGQRETSWPRPLQEQAEPGQIAALSEKAIRIVAVGQGDPTNVQALFPKLMR